MRTFILFFVVSFGFVTQAKASAEGNMSPCAQIKAACEKAGFNSAIHYLSGDVSEEELLKLITDLNNDENTDGILVQLPLPKHIDELKVITSVSPEKDVDAFHPVNIGKYVIGDESGFLPCTPYGIIQLLDEYKIETQGKDTVII